LHRHLGVIKQTFGEPKDLEVGLGRFEWVRELVSPGALDKQLDCFRIAMANCSVGAMRGIDLHIHPITKLWRSLSSSPMLPGVFPEFFKLAELAMIMVNTICSLIYKLYYLFIFAWFIVLFMQFMVLL